MVEPSISLEQALEIWKGDRGAEKRKQITGKCALLSRKSARMGGWLSAAAVSLHKLSDTSAVFISRPFDKDSFYLQGIRAPYAQSKVNTAEILTMFAFYQFCLVISYEV